MNRLLPGSWLILLCCLFIGCASSPTTDTQQTIPVANLSTLTPAEKKSYEQALSQLATGKYDKAAKILEKLALGHRGNSGLWINLANAHYENGDIKQASVAVDHAQKLSAKTPELHNIAGLIAVAKGDYKDAEKYYLAALTLNSNDANTHYNLALLYDVFYQDIRQAITHYERYLALGNQEDEETVNWLAELKLNLARGDNQ